MSPTSLQSRSWPLDWLSQGRQYPESFWRSLFYFNIYRLIVGVLCIVTVTVLGDLLFFGSYNPRLFLYTSIAYVLFGGVFTFLIVSRQPRFNLQLGMQVLVDIVALGLLMNASGGIRSGLGLLLMVSLAAAGLISRGRLTLFYAAIASIAVLLEETFWVLYRDIPETEYIQAGLLSAGFFAIAWMAHTLAQYTIASERLAMQRGIDLANMAQVNQLVIQDMQDGVLVVDKEGRVRQRNSRAEKLLGRIDGLSQPPLLKDYAPALAIRLHAWSHSAQDSFELFRVPETNSLVRTRFVPITDDRSVGAVIFLEDMGQVQAQAQQIKLAALGRLTANIAHEIRNPLSAISHASELLLEEQDRQTGQSRLLNIIRDNTRRLDRMVRHVLELNRRDRASPERIRMDAFLRTFVDEFCQAEKIPLETFRIDIYPERMAYFDRGHLNQVLWNLCRNAWHHSTRKDGSIRLRVRDGWSENSIVIDVIDDGPGVHPSLVSQLFEPFFTTVPSGTGLGLYIAREICEANSADLEYVEESSGGHFRIVCRSNHVKAQRTV